KDRTPAQNRLPQLPAGEVADTRVRGCGVTVQPRAPRLPQRAAKARSAARFRPAGARPAVDRPVARRQTDEAKGAPGATAAGRAALQRAAAEGAAARTGTVAPDSGADQRRDPAPAGRG